MSLQINKQMLESGMPIKVAAPYAGPLSIISTVGLGLLAVKPDIFRGIFNNDHCNDHRNNHCNDHGNGHGKGSGVYPNFYCEISELKDKYYYSESIHYTNDKICAVEKETAAGFAIMSQRIAALECESALDKQREIMKEKYDAAIALKNEIINQMELSRFVLKQTSNPPGQQVVDCCKPLHHHNVSVA